MLRMSAEIPPSPGHGVSDTGESPGLLVVLISSDF